MNDDDRPVSLGHALALVGAAIAIGAATGAGYVLLLLEVR